MNVSEIIEKMTDLYSSCRSYHDSGIIESNKSATRIDFQTYFCAPRMFRFQWTKDDQNYLIWSDGVQAIERYYFNNFMPEPVESLEHAIAGAIGISHGGAWNVPSLLIGDLQHQGRQFKQMREATIIGQECLRGVECQVLQGAFQQSNDTTIWVSLKDFSLRQIRESYDVSAEELRLQNFEALSHLQKQPDIPVEELERIRDFVQKEHGGTHYSQTCSYTDVQFNQLIDASKFCMPIN